MTIASGEKSSGDKGELHVGVLLGDPRLPCSYTVEGDLGEEWTRSVERLREILPELPGYRFTYFDDHERLIEDLRGQKPDLVLNLCDMGYRNDWELERNVPALLEMLGIPYTGADPASIILSADKALVSLAAARMGIVVPNETHVDLTADPLVLPAAYPAMIKPNSSGGSFGIVEDCVVHDDVAAEAYLRWLAGQLDRPEAVIQDFLTGREPAAETSRLPSRTGLHASTCMQKRSFPILRIAVQKTAVRPAMRSRRRARLDKHRKPRHSRLFDAGLLCWFDFLT